ncbi:MAG: hypothetical protein KKG53_14515 [Proteobacteria bacterium]|nr:hypothetical protein [Pseudomonadota bacterium]
MKKFLNPLCGSVLVGLLFLSGCTALTAPANRTHLLPDYYPTATDPNTTLYVDPATGEEKVVYDLNGHWKVWLGYAEAVAILQDGNSFVGQTVVGGGCCSHQYDAKRVIIRGHLDGNLIHCEKRTAGNDWEKSVTAVTGHAEAFYCLGWPDRLFERLSPTETYWPLQQRKY